MRTHFVPVSSFETIARMFTLEWDNRARIFGRTDLRIAYRWPSKLVRLSTTDSSRNYFAPEPRAKWSAPASGSSNNWHLTGGVESGR